jgi:hypothetical protein
MVFSVLAGKCSVSTGLPVFPTTEKPSTKLSKGERRHVDLPTRRRLLRVESIAMRSLPGCTTSDLTLTSVSPAAMGMRLHCLQMRSGQAPNAGACPPFVSSRVSPASC